MSSTEDKFHELYMLDQGWLRSLGPMQLNRVACSQGHGAWFMSLLLLSWNSSQFYLWTCVQYIQSKVTMGYAQRRGWAEEILWTIACARTAVIQQPCPQAQSAWPFDVHAHTAGLSRALCGLGSRARMSLRSLTVTATTAAKAAVAMDVGGSNSRTPGGRRACPSIWELVLKALHKY